MNLLYHYCSTESMFSIIKHRTVRLSSLSMSNDSTEGIICQQVMEELLNEIPIRLNNLPVHLVIRDIRETIPRLVEFFDGLGFCLSEADNLLSQWQAYADDGKGFAIGFNRSYFDALSEKLKYDDLAFSVERVLYTHEEHRQALMPIVEEIRDAINSAFAVDQLPRPVSSSDADPYPSMVVDDPKQADWGRIGKARARVAPLIGKTYTIKDPGFQAEHEVRLISHLLKGSDDPCEFIVSRGKIVPIRTLHLDDSIDDPIGEIILGPKNETPIFAVEHFLGLSGFANVSVRKSKIPYR